MHTSNRIDIIYLSFYIVLKIFVSYSRADGGEFAEKVYDYFSANSEDVFTDVNNIKGGDPWSKAIEENISTSDTFIVILTFAALRSTEVEKEVLQAKKERKRIVPAKYKNIRFDEVPWGLNANQGIEFETRDQLVTRLYEKIFDRKPPQPTSKKSLALTMILSIILAGLGHIYVGFKVRGIIIFIFAIVILWLGLLFTGYAFGDLLGGIIGWIIVIGYWGWQIWDAYKHFNMLKSGQR